jgi:hypothetical protein
VTRHRLGILVAMAAGCSSSSVEASPGTRAASAPAIELHAVAHEELCVTRGAIANASIAEPTVRAFARGTAGDAGQLTFKYAGESASGRALESGELRRQVGLKLRAADSCNVVYVMWRVAPKPGLAVQVKSNPGKHRHEECGADGYIKVKPTVASAVPGLEVGATHSLRAEIRGDELTAWIDGEVVWQGRLPDEARAFAGPVGLRTDNVKIEALALHAAKGDGPALQCKKHETDD